MSRNHARLLFAIALLSFSSRGTFAITFNEIARFSLNSTATSTNPEYIGSNPSAVAWTGNRLFVAGFNNTGGLADTGLIEVLNANATGLVSTPTFSPKLQTILTNAFRGYISLDVSADGNSLGVAYDDGQPFIEGWQVYNTSNNMQRWNFNARGSAGVAFDPGFQGMGTGGGTAFGQFGSNRRLLNDTTTGAVIFDSTNGFLWKNDTSMTTVRDIDFDPDTGDIYVRHNNQLSKSVRTAANTGSPQGAIVTLMDAPFVAFQNLSFLSNTSEGDLIIFNDRDSGAVGFEFLDSVRVVDPNGVSVSSTFNFLGGATPATGGRFYDFDFDVDTQTLALLDGTNRNVHIFEVGAPAMPNCDFNGDNACNGTDIDMLVANIAIGPPDPSTYDLTNDGMVNLADRDAWLTDAGGMNLPSMASYLLGDANLDGVVDGQDFIAWNTNKFMSVAAWTAGDFNADGVVDGQDFIVWNTTKFMSADGSAVPEPAAGLLLLVGLAGLRRRA